MSIVRSGEKSRLPRQIAQIRLRPRAEVLDHCRRRKRAEARAVGMVEAQGEPC